MKAIVLTKFGRPEVLQLQEVAKPVARDNEVLIRVHATSVFAGDCELRGLKLPVEFRLPLWFYLSFIRPKPVILGQELAGQVEAVGKDIHRFKPGDPVFAAAGFDLGAYAEYKCLPEQPGVMGGALAIKPANISYAEAATLPVGGLEALHFIRQANIHSGHQVLINGAGGSIGTVAVQLARLDGAEVTAVDSAEKLDMLRSIGADHVMEYQQADFTRSGQAYDVIMDVVGKSSFSGSLKSLKPNGRYLLANPGLPHRLRAVDFDRQQAGQLWGRRPKGGRPVIPRSARRGRETQTGHRPLLYIGTDGRRPRVCRRRAQKGHYRRHASGGRRRPQSLSVPCPPHPLSTWGGQRKSRPRRRSASPATPASVLL